MTSPNSTLISLFSKLNMEFDIMAANAFNNHKHMKTKFKEKYYSTYRPSKIDIYKWKKQLTADQIRYIEENCAEFMKKVGYIPMLVF